MRITAVIQRIFFAALIFATTHSASAAAQVVKAEPAGKAPLLPQVAASPSRITVDLDHGPKSGAIRLYNLGKKPVKVSATAYNWDLDENNQVRIIPPTPQSLDQWLIFNPVNFSIPPGKSQVVRLAVRPRAKPEPGEHRGIVFFEQSIDKEENTKGVRMKFRVGVAIYGLSGAVERRGELKGVSLEKTGNIANLLIDIESMGNAGVRMEGQYSLWPEGDLPSGGPPLYILKGEGRNVPDNANIVSALPSTPVLPQTRRVIRIQIALNEKPATYTLFVRGKLGEIPFNKTFKVTVP